MLRLVFGPSLAWRFSIPSLVILLVVGVATAIGVTKYMSASLEGDALNEATRDAEWGANMLGGYLLPEDMAGPVHGQRYSDLDSYVRDHVMHPGVVRVNIWSRTGMIVYSDEPTLVGRTSPEKEELAVALGGESISEASTSDEKGSQFEGEPGHLLEIYVPIRSSGSPEVLGVLETYEDYGRVALRTGVSQRAVYVGGIIGLTIVYLSLYAVHRRGVGIIARRERDLNESYDATLKALGSALDLRDHDTEGHCRRVSELATIVAEEMGVDDEKLEKIGRAATVHDIGKMTLPDAILLKPGPLTDEEWAEMKKHPKSGYEMLKEIPVLREAAEVVYAHHESYDGTGYPRELKGEEIPLGARIFAVVDAYDAMTSDRPYRKAMSHEEAVEEIVHCLGTQFDPEVVRAFCKAEKKGLIRARSSNGRRGLSVSGIADACS